MMVDVKMIYYLLYGLPLLFTVGTILFVIGIQVRGSFEEAKQKKLKK